VDVDYRRPWERTAEATKNSIEAAVDHGVPAESLAFYARWWQLETWLRQLMYLEFRAKWGIAWIDHLVPARFKNPRHTPSSRAQADKEKNAYMASRVKGGHPDSHLIGHGERNHDLLVQFRWSKRPWAMWKQGDPIAGQPGFFIHAIYHLRSAHATPLRLSEVLKREDGLLNHTLVYLLADPYVPEYAFASVDDPDVVNSSIAAATYDIFHVKRPGEPPGDWMARWDAAAGVLDHRVLVNSALNLAHPDTPFPVFAAMS
jgi:hypothetical protein